MTNKTILKLAAAAVALGASAAASATSMTLVYKPGSATLLTSQVNFNNGNASSWSTVNAGRLAFDVTAKDPLDPVSAVIYTFCIEPTQTIANPPTGVTYSVDALKTGNTSLAPNGLGATKAALISKLFAQNLPDIDNAMTANQAAAFQFAIWEIVGETSGVYNVTNGSAQFKIASSYSTTDQNAVISLANGYLNSLNNASGGQSVNGLFALDNNGAQDQVSQFSVTTPSRFDAVPEPAMLGLFGLGAVALGLGRRRKAA